MGKQGTNTSGMEYSKARRDRQARSREGAEKRRAGRSGEVVTYRQGQPKPDLPAPTERQVARQERWLWK
jgi:hypothetical protein